LETIEYYDSFNLAHTLAYSMEALQEMNQAYRFPLIFWNTANLIVDSGGVFTIEDNEFDEETYFEAEENNEVEEEDEESGRSTVSDYGKIASAIGRMQSRGVTVLHPDINDSRYTFTPELKKNHILYGLKGISRVGDSVVNNIIQQRPFTSFEDFLNKTTANKTQVINLIKSGALDCFGDRVEIMNQYMLKISSPKTTLNLRNVNMLITNKLLPESLNKQIAVFNFNKYIKNKEFKVDGNKILLNEVSFPYYERNFSLDFITFNTDGNPVIEETLWKRLYDKEMLKIKNYIKENHNSLLEQLNNKLINDSKEKYAKGNLAKWSMDSLNFYQNEHELAHVDLERYGLRNFYDLPEEPNVAYKFTTKDGKEIAMFELCQIAGTVIDRDKNKSSITLLTTDGVVIVKAYGVMTQYDKQISMKDEEGKKRIIEKSWFTRGNKIIVSGMRRGENTFIAKRYKNSPFQHHFTLIKDISEDGELELQLERFEVEE